jgi:multiple sugar transport system substrate-binding protein
MVYANTQCPQEAAEFAIGLFGAEDLERNVQWNTVLNTKLSPRASLPAAAADFYAEFPHDFFANEVFPIARPEPSFPPEIARAVWDMLQQAMFNGASGADATAAAAETINAYLESQ